MPKNQPQRPPDDAQDSPRDAFDIRALETMPEEEAESEWLRQPEAWHMR